MLWYDADLPGLDLSGLPNVMHFQGQGEVVVRSGFRATDTWVYLRSGPIYNGHQHDDQGNLLIEAHGGELFVENAGNGQGRSSNHNTLGVGGDQIEYGNNEVQHVQPIDGTSQGRGKVTEAHQSNEYTYVATDFSNAYADGQVAPPKDGKVTREMVVILPDIVVVRDRVTGSSPIELLLHTWSGDATTDSGAQTITVVNGSGQGWVKTLLPASAAIAQSSQGATDLYTVTPNSPSASEVFLQVFYLSPSANGYAPSDLSLIDEVSEQGAELTDRNGDHWQVRFEKIGVGLASVRKNDTPVPTDAGVATDATPQPVDGASGQDIASPSTDGGGSSRDSGAPGVDGSVGDGAIEDPSVGGTCGCRAVAKSAHGRAGSSFPVAFFLGMRVVR